MGQSMKLYMTKNDFYVKMISAHLQEKYFYTNGYNMVLFSKEIIHYIVTAEKYWGCNQSVLPYKVPNQK